jgi:hypothetical protein
MPIYTASYTTCSQPGSWYKEPVSQTVLIGAAGLLIGYGLGSIGGWGPGAAIASAALCVAGIYFCNWWLYVRLICLGGDRGAIGFIEAVDPYVPAWEIPSPGDFLNAFDTDWSFNLQLWPFKQSDHLPNTFCGTPGLPIYPVLSTPPAWAPSGNPWNPAALTQLTDQWGDVFPGYPNPVQVNLILPQQSMASLSLDFTGQDYADAPQNHPTPLGMLLHCEVEGSGMRDLRNLFWVLFAMFLAAAALEFIPIVGLAIYLILMILAWLLALFGSHLFQHEVSPPSGANGFGGTINVWNPANPNALVDIVYCYGRWVYDSLHSGWNEFHPLHFMIKLGSVPQSELAAGYWGIQDILGVKNQLDGQFGVINSPLTANIQAQPENRWKVHPLLDGCRGSTPYPSPPPTPPLIP